MAELTNLNGRRLRRILNVVYLALLGLILFLLWSHFRTWIAILGTAFTLVGYLVLHLLTGEHTKMMRDCPECGRILRFDPGSEYRKHTVGSGVTVFAMAQAMVQATEKKTSTGLSRDPSMDYNSWVCDKCGYALSMTRAQSVEIRFK